MQIDDILLAGQHVDMASLREYLSAREVLSALDPAFGAVGDGVTDDTVALKAVWAYALANGYRAIDFHGHTYKVLTATGNDVVWTTPDSDYILFEGSTSAVKGITQLGNPEYLVGRNFAVDQVRVFIFWLYGGAGSDFDLGMWRVRYTGDRYTGGLNLADAIERRGVVPLKVTGNCSGIRGWLRTTGTSYGCAFTSPSSSADIDDIELQPSNIDVVVESVDTGYPLHCTNGGHNIRAVVVADACGRSLTLEDQIRGHDITVISKNPTGSSDAAVSGHSGGGIVRYYNTESDTGTSLGRCLSLNYPVTANRVSRNNHFHVNIKTTGLTKFSRAVTVGLGVGVIGEDVDVGFLLEGFKLSGRIDLGDNTQVPLTVAFPLEVDGTTPHWTEGSNISNFNIENLHMTGAGAVAINLRGLKDVATIVNVNSDSALQLRGNTTGKIVCVNVRAPETVAAADASHIDFYSCNMTTGATFSTTNKNLYGTLINGALHSRVGGTLFFVPVVATGSLLSAAAANTGLVVIEDGGAGNGNLIIYKGAERFRIDGGAAF